MKLKAKKSAKPMNVSEIAKLQYKLIDIRAGMNSRLIEREEEVDIVLTSMLCKENPLLVGPPGTAKSMLYEVLLEHFSDNLIPFDRLLTKFTMPEELFGPLSLMDLKKDIFRRVYKGMLPEAHIVFLDEIFRGSSAILNTLLRILNERTFHDGVTSRKCPTILCMGAANNFPDDNEGGRELGAVSDRFLLRRKVKTIQSKQGRTKLLWDDLTSTVPTEKLTLEELNLAIQHAKDVQWSDEAKEATQIIIADLNKEGIFPGDRRLRKSMGAVQAYTFLCGSNEIIPEHLSILSHCLWEDSGEQSDKCANIVLRHANPELLSINEKAVQVNSILNDVEASNYDTRKTTEGISKLRTIRDALEESGNDRAESLSKVCCIEIDRLLKKMHGLDDEED